MRADLIWFLSLFYNTFATIALGKDEEIDRRFLGARVTFRDEKVPQTTTHCIGETFGAPLEWLFRFCEFRNLCYDITKQQLVIYPSEKEKELASTLEAFPEVFVSTVARPKSMPVSLNVVDPPHPDESSPKLIQDLKKETAWFPQVETSRPVGYYEIDQNWVLVPFRTSKAVSTASFEKRELISIFALLRSFGLDDKRLVPLNVDDENCDDKCQSVLQNSIMSSFGVNVSHTSSIDQNTIVCAKYGAAGLGMIMSGKEPIQNKNGDWIYTHTLGREVTYRAYEDFMNK